MAAPPLGPVSLTAAGVTKVLTRGQARAVLGFLLLNAGRVVSAEQLVEAVWALVSWFATVSRRWRATPAFRPRLWRGPALGGASGSFVESARLRLEDRRLSATEELIDLELTLGNHDPVAAEFLSLLDAYPVRDRLCRQLMFALYRAGRQVEALERYRILRGDTTLTTAVVERPVVIPGQLPGRGRVRRSRCRTVASRRVAAARRHGRRDRDDRRNRGGWGRRHSPCTGRSGRGTGSPTVSCS